MNKTIDILIPVYNGAKYIKRCLDGIISQTYRNINVVILNDGSADNSLEILEEYEKKDERIRLYSKENEGFVSIARNYLLNKIESDYFIFVDVDDCVNQNYVSLLAEAIERTGAEIACCEYSITKSTLSKSSRIRGLKVYDSKDAIPQFVLGTRGHFMLWNKLIKTDLLQGLRFNEKINYGEDMFFILDILQNSDITVASISNRLYYYRVSNFSSISKGGLNQSKKAFLETMIKYESEDRYKSNTRVITTWIYLTAYYFEMLAIKSKDTDYIKYLRQLRDERKDNIKEELQRIILEQKL